MHEKGGRFWLIVSEQFGKTLKSMHQPENVREEKIENEVWEERKWSMGLRMLLKKIESVWRENEMEREKGETRM